MSRLSHIKIAFIALAIAALANAASAQTPAVIDPRIVEFDPSPDHSASASGQPVVTRYDLELYVVGSTQATRVANLGKPSPQSDGKIRVDFTTLLTPWPAAGTTYEAKVAAVGPNGTGRSTGSNTFAFSSPCSSSISPASVSVGGGASTGNVTVTSVAGCPWQAASGAGWLTVTAGASGSGNGTVSYSVQANASTSQRSGALTIAGHTFTVTQSAGCTYGITPSATSVSSGASTGTVAVATTGGCPWQASSSAGWITITSGANGSGSGSVGYTVAANTSTTPRTGAATIAGRTFTVNQEGAPCNYGLTPVSTTIGPTAATGAVAVTAQSGCSWTAASGAGWITVTSGTNGSGNGQVGYSVSANPGTTTRNGAITVAGQAYNITQTGQACTFSISPVNTSISASAASSTIGVTALTGCAWTATTNTGWITLTSGANGSGNGTVGFSVAANPTTTQRSGTIGVNGQTFTVNQAGVVCTATINPLTASVGAGGGQGNVAVTIPAACQWTATSGGGWLTVTNGTGRTGSGSVAYNAGANTSTSSRSVDVTIAGQAFRVTQAGLTCTYTVTPLTPSVPATAGTASVSVSSANGCPWSASSSAGWMSISGNATGSGTGTVSYAFTANPTTATRAGVLTVAGQPVNVTQAAGCGYSISPASASMTAAAGNGTIAVSAGGTCAWNSQSTANWVTFSGGTGAGTGNGSVGYAVAANNNSSSRSTTITVAGQPFVITQAGAACNATLNPDTQSIAAAGADGSVGVAVPAGCTWSAVPGAGWISILTGGTGSGNGNTTFRVGANPNGTARSGTIAIGGRLLTVNQAAAACTSRLSSTSESFGSTGGSRVVSVTIPAGCVWNAASNTGWITVTAGAGPNNTGNAGVTFQVTGNSTTAARNGSLTISGQTVNVTQAGTCDVTIAPTSVSAGSAASTGTVAVTTGSSCPWTAATSDAWLSVTSGASGTGNGTVAYSMTANTTAAPRTATLTIGGRQFSVSQAAPTCTFTLSPTTISLTSGAASRSVTVTAGSTCGWTATSSAAAWLTVGTGSPGTGNGSVSFNVTANSSGTERTGTLTIAGQTVEVRQAGAGCTATLSPLSITVSAAGANASIGVTATGNCPWNATSNVPWVTLAGGGAGSGNGTLQYSVAPNTTPAERAGVITVAGRTFSVTQTAIACTSNLSSNGMSVPAGALNINVGVSVTNGCAWTAASNAAWIAVAAPAGGVGNGNASLAIAQNTGSAQRVGTATIAGRAFQVTQAGACQYSVSPTTVSVGGAAGTAGVFVTAGAGCTWSAQSTAGWVTLNTANGSGGGMVGLNIAANPASTPRSTTLTVAGTQVTVNQSSAACTITVSPGSMAVRGGNQSINITAPAGCAWTATATAAWLTFPNGAAGTGSRTLAVMVANNPTNASRLGVVNIGSSRVFITQSAPAGAPNAPVGLIIK